MDCSLPTSRTKLSVPHLSDVAKVLQTKLSEFFSNVEVSVTDCPDLSLPPFGLTSSGLCGNPRILDVGGVPYLMPSPQLDRIYDFSTIAQLIGLKDGTILGAGCGPCRSVGRNSELVVRSHLADGLVRDRSVIGLVEPDGTYIGLPSPSAEATCLVNLMASDGLPGQVIEVRASNRRGDGHFMELLQMALNRGFPGQTVGLGGVFLMETGQAKIHVMPDFSKAPLSTDEDVSNWLKFYKMDSPLTAYGVLVSNDPGLDLRTTHFHCIGVDGGAGHFHHDLLPSSESQSPVTYRAYFVIANELIRIDRPLNTHGVGRD